MSLELAPHSASGRATGPTLIEGWPVGTAPRPRPRARVALHIRCPYMLRGWRITTHARDMVDLRGFDLHAVAAACEHPEVQSRSRRYASTAWLYERGHITVVLEPVTRTVITVLLRGWSEWDDDDARRMNGVGA